LRRLRIASRGSVLARWQSESICGQLARLGWSSELVILKTSGDRVQQAISQIGIKGVFIKELEDALLDGRADLAVHSMKDVPTEIPAGLAFPAICQREDVRDCLVSREGWSLDQLPAGARLGTSSVRRRSQLLHRRPDLEIRDLRGNIDTRLHKLATGDYDAIVLAKAGLDRLGWTDRITETLSTEVSLPAVGQGALGMEARASDVEVCEILSQLDHDETRSAIMAERALLAELEGGCQVPLGAWARLDSGRLVLDACVCSPDGVDYIREHLLGSPEDPEKLGRDTAQKLLQAGAGRILRMIGRTVADD